MYDEKSNANRDTGHHNIQLGIFTGFLDCGFAD